ncbi:SGNH/GDSL hydrolase family protein, partial [Leclercia adecarboxylata]|uniref:SGNH/GDSL hydrolase family protein n=1 Tax=Leclercia adecarboxylata TaxID=83655 RepID=UPI00234C6232
GNPITIKLEQVSPDVAKRLAVLEAGSSSSLSRWRGQAVASFGDSLVGQGRWQPIVVSEHGIVHTNCGIGGSTVAKPDASTQAVSMCDQARIDAIPAGSVAVLFEGGTNDWAQSVPLGEFASTAETEFYGALHSTIGKLLTRFPQARIFCITSPYGERITVPGDWPNGWTNAIGLTVRAY